MDYAEEQQQEIEILQSIYPDELTVYSPTEFDINILLETASERNHRLKLVISYPETYPEVEPELKVQFGELLEGDYLEEDSDSESEAENKVVIIAETVDLSKQDLTDLQNELIDEAADNVGMPSVFTLASSLKDRAEQLFEQKVKTQQKRYDEDMLAREREEQKKFYGTKTTPETFKEWREKFRKELRIDERIIERKNAYHKGKMTGKQIFEAGLAGDEDDVEEITAGIEAV
jgi:hypothetical protein